MGYRKVGCLEQCWYIIQCWLRLKLHKTKEDQKKGSASVTNRGPGCLQAAGAFLFYAGILI